MAGTGIEAIQVGAPKKAYKLNITDLYPYQYNQRLDTFGFDSSADIKRIIDLLKSDDWQDMDESDIEYILSNLGDEADDSSMAWLKNSIVEEGLKESCTGFYKSGKVYLTEGNRRLFAGRLALLENPGLELVFRVETESTGGNDVDYVKRQLIVNTKNRISHIEQAMTIKQLMKLKQLESPDEIREELKGTIFHTKVKGNDIKLIRDRLALLEAAPEIQRAVLQKEIAPTTVVSMLRGADTEEEQELATEAIIQAVEKRRENGGKQVKQLDVVIEKSRLIKSREQEFNNQIEGDVQDVEDVMSGKMLPRMRLPEIGKVTSIDVVKEQLSVWLDNTDFPEEVIRNWWKEGQRVWRKISK